LNIIVTADQMREHRDKFAQKSQNRRESSNDWILETSSPSKKTQVKRTPSRLSADAKDGRSSMVSDTSAVHASFDVAGKLARRQTQ